MRIETPLPPDLEHLIRRVIGCAIEVHRHLGPGFLESIYERALCYELEKAEIRYEAQREIVVRYKEIIIPGQRLDVLVDGQIILELKTVDALAPIHEAQLISYLKATGLKVGLLLNFKSTTMKHGIKRMVV
jgi:GxxExxY protein